MSRNKYINMFLEILGLIALVFLLIWSFKKTKAQETYRLSGKKLATWAAFGVAGALHGGREALHADPQVFEKKWGVSETSFWGSKQWLRQYHYNNPDAGHRAEWLNWSLDYWHFSGAASKTIWVGGSFIIGAGRQKLKYKVYDLLIGSLVTTATANMTYNYLR